MAKRNMYQIAKKTKVKRRYDLVTDEMEKLFDTAQGGIDGTLSALYTAFKYGYAMGERATKRAPKEA